MRAWLLWLLLVPALGGDAAIVELGSESVKVPGSAFSLRFFSESFLSPTASGLHQEAAFYLSSSDPKISYALFAVPLEREPGPCSIRVRWKEGGAAKSAVLKVMIGKRPGKLRRIHLPPSASKALGSLAADKPLLVKALKEAAGLPFWRGDFMLPVSGTVSTPFGVPRLYLPGGYLWRHKGIDFAVPNGSTVSAANDGEVLLAREGLAAYGGLLVLSHGYGLTTTYMHLSHLLVSQGQKVSKGQAVALSGALGIATGPHLHWQMDLHSIAIDPEPWLGGSFRKN